MRLRRPFSVTLVALLVLTLAVMKLIRLVLVMQSWAFYGGLLSFSPIYLAISGLLWAVIGLPLAAGLWFGLSWASIFTRVGSLVYTFYYWLEYFLLVNTRGRQQNWAYLLFANIAVLIWIYWVLSRDKAKIYFGVDNERRSENQ